MTQYRKKLIEVALPLDDINRNSAAEKSLRGGHPSSLHLWWARRPLVAARAILFAQLVDDPSSIVGEFPSQREQDAERIRLLGIISDLCRWDATADETVLQSARYEIARSCARDSKEAGAAFASLKSSGDVLRFLEQYGPAVLDPFAGGGTIPLEAHRLGLTSKAGDLNPVAVLINKAQLEIPKSAPPRPVSGGGKKPTLENDRMDAHEVLSKDVAHYAKWMGHQAKETLRQHYPTITAKVGDQFEECKVVSWLWARTVQCPNPACLVDAPLMGTTWLFKKKGGDFHLRISYDGKTPVFTPTRGAPPPGFENTKGGKKATFLCANCRTVLESTYIRSQAEAGKLGQTMTAVVVLCSQGRIFLRPNEEHVAAAVVTPPAILGDHLPHAPRYVSPPLYGLTKFSDMYTARQLVALHTFSGMVKAACEKVLSDAERAFPGRRQNEDYAKAIELLLAFGVDKLADLNNSLCTWKLDRACPVHIFARQAIPMVWDFPEANPIGDSSGSWHSISRNLCASIVKACMPGMPGTVEVRQASALAPEWAGKVVLSTDPPYYDNIGYADLSDFFYVWLRQSLEGRYSFLSSIVTPKEEELVSNPYRHGSKAAAERHFEDGLFSTFSRLRANDAGYPGAIYYAFKQSEKDRDGYSSTGWMTFLAGVLRSGYMIEGTWPIKSEMKARQVAMGTNALASSIVLAVRPRSSTAGITTRQEFVRELKRTMPDAISKLQKAGIAPVDLAQAAIGPGMALFSRFQKVLEPDGEPMTVRAALQLINQALDEARAEQEGEFDPYTRWAITWYEQHGSGSASYGEAETLATAKGIAMEGLSRRNVVRAAAGSAALRMDATADLVKQDGEMACTWTAAFALIDALEAGGEEACAKLHGHLGGLADQGQELAFWLFRIAEQRGDTEQARRFNGLVSSWLEIERLSASKTTPTLEAF